MHLLHVLPHRGEALAGYAYPMMGAPTKRCKRVSFSFSFSSRRSRARRRLTVRFARLRRARRRRARAQAIGSRQGEALHQRKVWTNVARERDAVPRRFDVRIAGERGHRRTHHGRRGGDRCGRDRDGDAQSRRARSILRRIGGEFLFAKRHDARRDVASGRVRARSQAQSSPRVDRQTRLDEPRARARIDENDDRFLYKQRRIT